MEEFLSALLVVGLSTIKFLSGIVTSMGLQQGLLPSYVSTVGGGVLGVFVFTFFGELISRWYHSFFPNRTKRNFTSWNRFIVKLRRNFGLPGIAFLTPILSIPVGIFLSLSLTSNKWRILLSMFVSFLIWTTLIFVPYYLLDFDLSSWLSSIF